MIEIYINNRKRDVLMSNVLVFAIVLSLIPYMINATEEEIVVLSSGDTHREYRYSVPFHPASLRQVPESQIQAWETVLKQCVPINTREPLSESCWKAVEEYFLAESVWDNRMYHYRDGNGLRSMLLGKLNGRDSSTALPYSVADFQGDFPLWRDMFDDKILRRMETFLRVVKEQDCINVASKRKVGIHEIMASQCAAREMYKYATYLDTCSRSSYNLNTLTTEVSQAPASYHIHGPPNIYEISLQVINSKIEDADSRSLAERRMQRGYLLASWTMKQCDTYGYVLLPGTTIGSTTSDDSLLAWSNYDRYRMDDRRLLNRTHDKTLKIAAKSGDDWAIRSYHFSLGFAGEFNDDLKQKYPLLVHRWIGGTNAKSDYRRRHQAKAYLLLKEEHGVEVASLEYDSSELADEIPYIQKGGDLKYTPRWHKDYQRKPVQQPQAELED